MKTKPGDSDIGTLVSLSPGFPGSTGLQVQRECPLRRFMSIRPVA